MERSVKIKDHRRKTLFNQPAGAALNPAGSGAKKQAPGRVSRKKTSASRFSPAGRLKFWSPALSGDYKKVFVFIGS